MKLTEETLERLVEAETYARPAGGTLTICVLSLAGGATVTGEANVIDPANFSAPIGQAQARKDAIGKMWQLEGYHQKRMQAMTIAIATAAAHASVMPGWSNMTAREQEPFFAATMAAVDMAPDDDIPEAITELLPTDAAAARYANVARAACGL